MHTWNAWLSIREHFPFLPPLGTTPLPDPTILVPLSGDQSPLGVFSISQAIVSLAQKHVRTHTSLWGGSDGNGTRCRVRCKGRYCGKEQGQSTVSLLLLIISDRMA